MDDALARNGYQPGQQFKIVLILVVMDDALAQCKKGRQRWVYRVLILVVMDDALALRFEKDGETRTIRS